MSITPRRDGNRLLNGSRRAQSSVIGVLLLTAVIIITVSTIGVFFLGTISEQADASERLVDLDVELTNETIEVHHATGDAVDYEDLALVLRKGSTTERYEMDKANVTGNANDQFEPGETFARNHSLGSGAFRVRVFHTASNSMLHSERLDAYRGSGDDDDSDDSDDGSDPTAAFTVAPGDPEPGQTLTFDAGGSSDADGSIASYEWAFGDGSTATGETVTHSYSSSGDYDVSLTVTDEDGRSATLTKTLSVDNLRAADNPANTVEGIDYQYYEADDEYASMPDFDSETPVRTGVSDQIDLDPAHREEEFAFRFTGYIEVPEDGEYTLSTRSDDGSELYVGDELVVDNGGLHSNQTSSGTIGLEAGKHAITVTMFEHTGDEGLEIGWSGPGVTDGVVPASAFYRVDSPIATMGSSCTGPECSFDASGSTNPGGSIASYEWDFGDGNTTTGEVVDHTYAESGQYTVALTVTGDGGGTDTVERTIDVSGYEPAIDPGTVVQGVEYDYYEAEGQYGALTDVDWSNPTRSGTTDAIDLDPSHRGDDFAFQHQTYLDVPEDGIYTFYTNSDDGSVLFVDGTEVVDNRGEHPAEEASGQIALEGGYHNVTVRYFERGGQEVLSASYESDSIAKQQLPTNRLYRPAQQASWSTAADWDDVVVENGVVHEDYGDRSAASVELGYPTGGEWGPTPTNFWPLDEDTGSTTTDVVGTNAGTVEGATIGQPGTLGTSGYAFDSSSDEYVDTSSNLDTLQGTASLSVWVNTQQTGSDTAWQAPGITGVEESGGVDDVFWGWIDADGHIGIQAGDDSGAMSSTQINDGNWHHVVLTRDANSGEVQVYVDGTVESTTNSAEGVVTNSFSSIGRIEDTGETPEYFDGRLDDVSIYDRVLSAGEVAALDAAGTNGDLTTATKTFDRSIDPSGLKLQNVSATVPTGTTATVTVYSDPDGDGTMEEQSDEIDLASGASSYSVTGLTTASSQFELSIELTSTDPAQSPSIDGIDLVG